MGELLFYQYARHTVMKALILKQQRLAVKRPMCPFPFLYGVSYECSYTEKQTFQT